MASIFFLLYPLELLESCYPSEGYTLSFKLKSALKSRHRLELCAGSDGTVFAWDLWIEN
jgi:hypothetical protein